MDGKKETGWQSENEKKKKESRRGVLLTQRVGLFLWLGQQKGELRTRV